MRSLTKLNNIISLVQERSLLQSLVYYIYVGKTSMSPWPLLRFSGISLLRYSVAGLHAAPHGKPLANEPKIELESESVVPLKGSEGGP